MLVPAPVASASTVAYAAPAVVAAVATPALRGSAQKRVLTGLAQLVEGSLWNGELKFNDKSGAYLLHIDEIITDKVTDAELEKQFTATGSHSAFSTHEKVTVTFKKQPLTGDWDVSIKDSETTMSGRWKGAGA
jgi:hypothetical protein